MEHIRQLIRQYDVILRPAQIDGSVRGFARKYQNGYLVIINQDINRQSQRRTIMHELLHIQLGHLDDRRDLPEEEKEEEVREALKAMGY